MDICRAWLRRDRIDDAVMPHRIRKILMPGFALCSIVNGRNSRAIFKVTRPTKMEDRHETPPVQANRIAGRSPR
jgi:hypothetical protein